VIKTLLIGFDHASSPDKTIIYKGKFERKAVAMKEYLITDKITGSAKWVAGNTVTEALIKRENELRADPKEGKWRFSQRPLHESTPADVYQDGAMLDAGIADVRCRGERALVVREVKPRFVLTGIGGVTL
jgi:uncharacterized protein YcbX